MNVMFHGHPQGEPCNDLCGGIKATAWKPPPWRTRAKLWLVGFLQGVRAAVGLKPKPPQTIETCPACGKKDCETWATLESILAKANRKTRWGRFMDWYYGKWYRGALVGLTAALIGAVIGQVTKHI